MLCSLSEISSKSYLSTERINKSLTGQNGYVHVFAVGYNTSKNIISFAFPFLPFSPRSLMILMNADLTLV